MAEQTPGDERRRRLSVQSHSAQSRFRPLRAPRAGVKKVFGWRFSVGEGAQTEQKNVVGYFKSRTGPLS
jgi:hypothetical protein